MNRASAIAAARLMLDDAELAGRYEAGATTETLSALTGLSRYFISQAIERSGVSLRQPGWQRGRTRPDAAIIARDTRILTARESGRTMASIGAEYGVSRQRVEQIVSRRRK